MDLAHIEGFEWDEHNFGHVILEYPDRNLSIDELESVFQDENLLIWFIKYDERRQTPCYLCLGQSKQGRLIRLNFELTKSNLARIFNAYPTTKSKYKKLYSSQ